MKPPPDDHANVDQTEAQAAVEALLNLITGLLETGMEIVTEVTRDEQLAHLAIVCADLDLFARAAVRAGAYVG